MRRPPQVIDRLQGLVYLLLVRRYISPSELEGLIKLAPKQKLPVPAAYARVLAERIINGPAEESHAQAH